MCYVRYQDLSWVLCADHHLELLADLHTMPTHQATRRCMPAMVTGVDHHLLLTCRLLLVLVGPQNRCILQAFPSRHYWRHQSRVGPGRQESGPRHLHLSQGTLMLRSQCRHGKRWADHTRGTVEIDRRRDIYRPALVTLMFFTQMLAEEVRTILQLKRCQDGTSKLQQTWMWSRHIWEHEPAIGGRKKKVLRLLNDCADKLLDILLVAYHLLCMIFGCLCMKHILSTCTCILFVL